MKTTKNYFIALMIFAFSATQLIGQESQDNRERWNLITMQGTVTDIVKETREITLMGSNGNLATITADKAVERFDEIVVNDVITFEYWTYMMAEFRAPTPEEIAEPLVVVAEAAKAPEEMDPAAGIGAVVKAVVTIEVLNRPYMLATVKGPGGNYLTIEMEDTELITQLHIGQVIILTYAEAIVMSLTKVNLGE